jgi:hypothetical protein
MVEVPPYHSPSSHTEQYYRIEGAQPFVCEGQKVRSWKSRYQAPANMGSEGAEDCYRD